MALDPFAGLRQRSRDQLELVNAPTLTAGEETDVLENAQVFRDRRRRYVERRRQLADRCSAVGEPSDDRAAGGIGQRREQPVERIRL